jgi:hypothetical protein
MAEHDESDKCHLLGLCFVVVRERIKFFAGEENAFSNIMRIATDAEALCDLQL